MTNSADTTPQPLAPAQGTATDAQAQMNALTGDKGWVDRFLTSDPAAVKEFKALTGAIVDGGAADDVVASIMGGKAPELGNTVQREMASTVEMFREMAIDDGVTKQFISGEKVSAQEYQAVANLKRELMGSAEFVEAYLGGDLAAKKRMSIINAVLVNGVKVETAA
ncbi:hypothetical protein [Bradyrhizobium sp. WSM1253]|uniref:hypothetical protein n=1 Tax=Bradyrhizobium sp. WSM1253 TaxID=319003 RepID=UPI00025D2DF2|nr:hypothetical protein [Bradyrhizobium sp. WSM1253]EIG63480.1 hypothetical protein Bra1253DRAFT_08455 [Bradyrhizobium sp. WSM1253]